MVVKSLKMHYINITQTGDVRNKVSVGVDLRFRTKE